MRVLDRLVLGSFVKLFCLAVIATPPLFILADLVEEIDRYLDRGLGVFDVSMGYVYQLPQYVIFSFPIAGLIATVFTIYGMTTHREIVAAKAGGVSFHRLITPILLMSVVLTGAALGLTWLAPHTNAIAFDILESETGGREWRDNFVYRTETGLTVQARHLAAPEGMIRGIVVQRAPDAAGSVHWVKAREARWTPETGWTLTDGHLRIVTGVDLATMIRFDSLRIVAFGETPEELLQQAPDEEEMTYAEIEKLATSIERSGGAPHKLRVRQEQKISIPLATLVIILFGAPLATSHRRGGAAFGIGVALGTTILYMALLRVAGGFGSSGALSPLYAAWLPNAVFLVAGLSLMSRVRT